VIGKTRKRSPFVGCSVSSAFEQLTCQLPDEPVPPRRLSAFSVEWP
jgi:hypothetical protein